MNPTTLAVIGPGFLHQVPTLPGSSFNVRYLEPFPGLGFRGPLNPS